MDKKKYTYLILILLIVASAITYGRILSNGFLNYDDDEYITENSHVQSGINPESIKWAFSAVVCNNWHPLTWLSHMLDWRLFKDHAGGHHLINLLLHIGSVLLLFLFLNRTTNNIWSAAFAAALFALHPLRVESIAWASERKDVLSMFFGLASIYAYAFYTENYKLSQYFLCLSLFALSLLAKPMLVTLPFILLLLDYWPLGRWTKELYRPVKSRGHLIRWLLWEKTPFLFLTILSSIVTLWVQNKSGSVVPVSDLSFPTRVVNAIISYFSYLGKIFWPVDLAVFYPYEHSFGFWQIMCSCFILIGITIIVIYAMKKLSFLFVGWFWYLGTLIPVIGLVQVGGQAMADRYTYLPSIGIAVILAWGIPLLFSHEDRRKKILFPAAITALAILAVLTSQQCGYWKNSITLYNHTLQVTKNNAVVHNNLAFTLFAEGRIKEAIDHYNKAISINPHDAEPYNNRGTIYEKNGQYELAINDFNKVISLRTDYIKPYNNRGNAYAKLGQYRRAIEDFNKAIVLKPDDAEVYYNRGIAYYNLGQYQRAIEDYNEAIRITPSDSETYNNRGAAYIKLGQSQRASENFNQAIKLKKDYIDAYNNRGISYFNQGEKKLGCLDVQKACELGNCTTLAVAKGKGYCR